MAKCPACEGTSPTDENKGNGLCASCNGTGTTHKGIGGTPTTCSKCGGSGECPRCNGTGEI